MSVYVSIHVGTCKFSHYVYGTTEQFGTLYLDADHRLQLMGSESELRALADCLIDLADDVAYRSRPTVLERERLARRAGRAGVVAGGDSA